jgi:hypothetical protein
MPEHASNTSNAFNDLYYYSHHSDFFDLAGMLEQPIEGIRRPDCYGLASECGDTDTEAIDSF